MHPWLDYTQLRDWGDKPLFLGSEAEVQSKAEMQSHAINAVSFGKFENQLGTQIEH